MRWSQPTTVSSTSRRSVSMSTRSSTPTPAGTQMATTFVDLDRGRLLDVVPGRSGEAVRHWLGERHPDWADQIAVAAVDGFRGYATASADALPDATLVIDHFHAIRLASEVVNDVRRRVQQDTLGHRGRRHDPLSGIRRRC
jgi:transposase